jgi:hypothetical protein
LRCPRQVAGWLAWHLNAKDSPIRAENRISRIFYRPERGNNYLPFDGGREAVRFKMRNTDCRCG